MKAIVKAGHLLHFLLFYLYKLVLANLRVTHDALTPTFHTRPAIIEVELNVQSAHSLFFLSNLITMTPGTLTLDITPDGRKIYIHAMYVEDVEEFKKNIKKLEKRVLTLLQ